MHPLEISPQALAAKLSARENFVLLDVRTPREHAFVSLPDSRLIPLQALEARLAELAPFSEKEFVVYCHHGVRSLDAVHFLGAHGFSAKSLAGGIEAYAATVDPGLPRY